MARILTDTMRAIAVTPKKAGSAQQVELPKPQVERGMALMRVLSAGNRNVEIPADVINLQMVLGNRVAFGSVNANRRYFDAGVQHFQQAEQRWPGIFDRLITRRMPLADFRSALDRRPEDIKTLRIIAAR